MARHYSLAPNFRISGGAKEFITDDGKCYLVLKFQDSSILVLQKKKGTKRASAEYAPIKAQKRILESLGCREGTTYQMGQELFR